MEETKTCPKCGGEMEQGRLYPIHLKTIVTFGKPRKEKRRKRDFNLWSRG